MRILLMVQSEFGALTRWPRRNYFDFYRSLSAFAEFYQYGPNEQKRYGEKAAPLEYSKKHSMEDIMKELKPDIVIVWNWPVPKKWLPPRGRGKYSRQIPFLGLTGDYFSVPTKDRVWFDQWDLLLTRGAGVDVSERKIPSVWLPQAVDEKEFFTDPASDYLKNREKKIVWIGNTSKFPYYETRIAGLEKLRPTGLLKDIGLLGGKYSAKDKEYVKEKKVKLMTEPYAAKLKEYVGAFSCAGGTLHSTLAKHFEIMGSGTAMLCQHIKDFDVLFGKKQCYFTYEDDLSDLIPKAEEIINDHDKVEEVTRNALTVINANHLHYHRRIELFEILKALISGGEIPKRWGR